MYLKSVYSMQQHNVTHHTTVYQTTNRKETQNTAVVLLQQSIYPWSCSLERQNWKMYSVMVKWHMFLSSDICFYQVEKKWLIVCKQKRWWTDLRWSAVGVRQKLCHKDSIRLKCRLTTTSTTACNTNIIHKDLYCNNLAKGDTSFLLQKNASSEIVL